MSTRIHILGLGKASEEWYRMKAIYDACLVAGVTIPRQVSEFFNYSYPEEIYQEINIARATKIFNTDTCQGFDVDISLIPDGVKIIRFFKKNA